MAHRMQKERGVESNGMGRKLFGLQKNLSHLTPSEEWLSFHALNMVNGHAKANVIPE